MEQVELWGDKSHSEATRKGTHSSPAQWAQRKREGCKGKAPHSFQNQEIIRPFFEVSQGRPQWFAVKTLPSKGGGVGLIPDQGAKILRVLLPAPPPKKKNRNKLQDRNSIITNSIKPFFYVDHEKKIFNNIKCHCYQNTSPH